MRLFPKNIMHLRKRRKEMSSSNTGDHKEALTVIGLGRVDSIGPVPGKALTEVSVAGDGKATGGPELRHRRC